MKLKKSFDISEELLNKIISVAYGDAGIWDRFSVNRLAGKYPEVKSILDEYKETASEVSKINEAECPSEILNRVENTTIKTGTHTNSCIRDLLNLIFLRPVLSAAVVIVLIGFTVYGILDNRMPEQNYTMAEIQIADKQAMEALAIVGRVFEQTNITLKEEVLNSRVAKPIRESMGIVNDFLTPENKQNKEK